MFTSRRILPASLAILLLLPACGLFGGDEPEPTGSPETETEPGPTESTLEGAFVYNLGGIEASFTPKANGTGGLEIHNSGEADLPEPGLYLLDARDGSRISVVLADAPPLAVGEQLKTRVEIDPPIQPQHIGLVVLLFGDEDFGAFLPEEFVTR